MSVALSTLVAAYLAFHLKQWLADFVLQSGAMAAGKAASEGWAAPLARHCAIHAGCTFAMLMVLAPSLWFLALVDFLVHGVVDKTKAEVTRGWLPSEQRYWSAFGLDQMAHHLTHLGFLIAIALR